MIFISLLFSIQQVMDSSQILYNSIFNLPQHHSQITSAKALIDSIQQIIAQIKSLKAENRSQQIQKKCFKNQKLVYVSKIMKQNYYRVYDILEQQEDPFNLKNLTQADLMRKQSVPMSIYSNPSGHILANSRLMITKYQYKLKYLLISMFYNMLVNQKMITFLNSMSVPFHVYVMLLRSLTLCGKSCLRYKETQKCLKFIYNYIKVTKQNIPKVYLHLIKNFLQLYHKNNEVQYAFDLNNDNKDRIKLCYSYIFQISVLVLRKNLFLASKCGILSLLYHKCIEGAFTIHKVQSITEIIINYCVEQKSRLIIYSTIDLGKTFAIFTNIDMVQSINQKNDRINTKSDPFILRGQMKKKESLLSCAIMIQMYLSSWPTLIYFLQQIKTLDNFIISLKRKEDQELIMLNKIIFNKIMMRCINYNRKKIMKSNNLFNIQSNYLIIKSLMVLNYFFKHQDFKKLLYSHSCMIEIRQNFTQILLEYFISNDEQYKNKDFSKILINNIRNINYYKKINTDFSKKRIEQKGVINNNIESYYTQSLLPFEFNVQQLKSYLFKILRVIQQPKSKELVSKLLSDIAIKYQDNKQLEQKQLLEFYKLGMSILQQIQWFDKYLDISKYLSSILSHLRSSKSIIDISQKCRQYIKNIFENPQNRYFQYLSINILDDIGRYFYSDNKVIEYLNGYISDNIQAYKISRILLHIDYQRNNNQSIDGPQKVYSQISKRGSRALILQIIQIIKYSCQQNDNRFLNEHLQILFTLIYVDDEDIVYSIIELLQEFVNKSKELQDYILKIDVKKIRHWNKRVFYLFLHVENPVLSIKQTLSPNFLKDELQKWESDENRKKTYYLFTLRQLKKFTQDSILSTDYLNLGLDPANYRKLIFLPWNIKINDQFYAIFIQYKNLQDKLKLKIYLNIIIMKEIIIQQLYIGSHNYTKYIQPKVGFEKKPQDNKIRLSLEQIKKEHQNKGRDSKKFVMQRQQAIFFINYEQGIYKIQRININIPLTLDTYRPLSHPLNYINLLCRKEMGYEFLKKQKFIEHCLEIIKNDQSSSISKQQYNGALVCLGTLCASKHMQINEKIEIYEIITKKFLSSKNYQIQEICFWIINILIRHHVVRNRVKNYLILIETKRCEWICLPDITALEKRVIDFRQRITNNLKYVRDNLPQKLQNDAFRYLSNILNDNLSKEEQTSSRYKQIFEQGNIDGRVLESIIKYVSVIDFTPIKIYQAIHKLAYYIVSDKFQQDYPNGFWLS